MYFLFFIFFLYFISLCSSLRLGSLTCVRRLFVTCLFPDRVERVALSCVELRWVAVGVGGGGGGGGARSMGNECVLGYSEA